MLQDGEVIFAKVWGTRDYRVRLWVEGGEVQGECSCPMGDAYVFCKHCVAVGLAYLEGGTDDVDEEGESASPKAKGRRRKAARPRVTLDDVRRYLAGQNKTKLVEIIVRQATEDDRLRESLFMKVARDRPEGPDVATFREAIDNATDTGGFVDYHSAYGFARGIDEVVTSIADLLEDGHADATIELAEHALARCEDALGAMDDSDGEMTGIIERLGELHHAACVVAKPDPEALARRLFAWELKTDWDTFYGAAEGYADVLGQAGLAVYRKLAQGEWDKVPALGPGQDRRSFGGHRFRLTSIMESLARVDGDVEALVAVKQRDLSSPYHYLQIAEIYKGAKQSNKALEWAENGLKAFPDRPDNRLREFLAAEYHRRKRRDEAMALIWAEFAERPSLETYQLLKQHANRVKQWPTWREKALAHIRQEIAEAKKGLKKGRPRRYMPTNHSTLVEIFLWEKDGNAAWREARAGGCSDRLWMQLARLREKDHPADALEVYKARVDPIVQRTNNEAYREAVRLIRKTRQLSKRLGQTKEFKAYLEAIRATHKRKRNFMKLLDRMK